jgi:hypothetical protein
MVLLLTEVNSTDLDGVGRILVCGSVLRRRDILTGTQSPVTVCDFPLSAGNRLRGLITGSKSSFYTALTIHNKTENNNINPHAQDTTELQLSVILTGTLK